MFHALWLSAGLIFAAELGDKSQLMALAFAARYRAWPVLAGITLATAVVHAGSVAVGSAVAGSLPTAAINVVAGLAFLGFAAWTWRGDELTRAEEDRARAGGAPAFVAAGTAFFLAELGDKTMLATVTLATRYEAWGTWIGSTVGMVAADALAIAVGAALGRRLLDRTVRRVAAVSFVVFGGLLVYEGLTA
ncbi:MAG: TMEM165/GDT1 family protein [Actinobacteria bacterium]|nr:TMEM165/GDT1 family protein [Actinomycetota bacterium]